MDTIYYGGPILTMENREDNPEAVLVSKGLIKKVGTLREALDAAESRLKKIDLNGKCLMPAFIDAHGHITMTGQMSACANLSDCESFDDIAEEMKKYISEKGITEKDIAMGFGYDHNFLKEQSHPGKAVLDRVSETIPVMILHVSGHMGCANSAALRVAGIDEHTPDPQGGKIGRVAGSEEPDGYLEEKGMIDLQDILLKQIKVNLLKMMKDMQTIYIENGVTTVQDGLTNGQGLKLLKAANRLGKLKIDVVAYPMMTDGGKELLKKNRKLVRKYNKHLKIGGYKLVLDGSPQGRSAWMSQPYLGDDTGYCAYPWMTDEDVAKYALDAVNESQQLLVHCNGDAASEQFIDAYSEALAKSSNPNKGRLRPAMIHCQTVRNDQLDRMADMSMIASIFVGHVFYWGDVHMKNFGAERGNHISPVKDALDRDITVNFHQDTPITKPKMLHSVWCAVNRISRNGNEIGSDQKISVYDALKAVTIDGAFEYFEEDSKGSIKEGKRADMVILDKNPLSVDTMQIADIQILETIKDGERIYRKK